MKPLAALPRDLAAGLTGVVFDLDDTLLDHGELSLAAYASLFRLRDAGLRLIACTGRPAGWAEVFARSWPIDGALGENGAIGYRKLGPGRVAPWDPTPPGVRRERCEALASLSARLRGAIADLVLADDVALRRTDVAFDIGERRRVEPAIVQRAQALIRDAGARTFVSTVHLHATFDAADKASGTVAFLADVLGDDPTSALRRWAFVGDSENDAAAFASFRVTFGVANVRTRLAGLTVPPRFVAEQERGAGFAQIAQQLVSCRAPCAEGPSE